MKTQWLKKTKETSGNKRAFTKGMHNYALWDVGQNYAFMMEVNVRDNGTALYTIKSTVNHSEINVKTQQFKTPC